MHFRKLISIWALLALLLGQLALAEHNATHIDHGYSQEIVTLHDGHNDDGHDQQKKKHSCPECVLIKSLQTAFYNAPALDFIHSGVQSNVFSTQSNVVVGVRYNANSPRAPPLLLI